MLKEAGDVMLRCPSCGHACKDLNKHYGLKPACFKIESEKPPAPRARASTAGDEAESHFKLKFARRINIDYANLRYKRFMDTSSCDAFHAAALAWIDMMFDSVIEAALSATSIPEASRIMRRVFNEAREVLVTYQSQERRDAYLIKTLKLPYIKPVPYTDDLEEFKKYAAKFSVREVLGRLLQHDRKARKLIVTKSVEWMKGDKHNVKSDVLTDITDGWRCRSHPHLMRKATAIELEEKVIRVGIGIHNDDVTFANPIGTKRGEHKDSITDASIINLPLNMRHSFEYILLLSVVNSKVLKERGGLEWSLCGIDEMGKETVNDSLAAELRACSFDMKLPNDEDPTGEDIPCRVEVYFIIMEADWLAAAAMGYGAQVTVIAARAYTQPPPETQPENPAAQHSADLCVDTGTHPSRRQLPIRAKNACGCPRPLASGAGKLSNSPTCARTPTSLQLPLVSQLRSCPSQRSLKHSLLRA